MKRSRIYLVSYDIKSDNLRVKIAEKLLYFGLERIQYSVFLGPMKAWTGKALHRWLRKQQLGEFDKVAILPMHRDMLSDIQSYGQLDLKEALATMESDLFMF